MLLDDPSEEDFAAMREVAGRAPLRVVDARPELRRAALGGRWPHGFHNGQIGSGHLNAVGNHIVASHLVAAAEESVTSPAEREN